MKKKTALDLLAPDCLYQQNEVASLLGMTRQAVSHWPDDLNQKQTDVIIGAAVRLGLINICGVQSPQAKSALSETCET